LLNNQAVCALNQGKFDEAQSLLQEALDKVNSLAHLSHSITQ
jgi:hypothetical protein